METSSESQDTPQRPQISFNRGSYREKFQGERKELLELAFLGEKEVKVEEPLSGYSGAQTWRVATDRRVFVIKLAHPSLIEREYVNYRTHVIEHLGNTSRVQGEPIKSTSREWALLKSTFARLRQSQTLLAYVEKKGSVDIAKILNNIFREYGEPWWGNAQNTRITCGVYYDRLLPVHLELVAFPPDGSDPAAKDLKAGEVAQDQIADLEKDVIEHGHRPNIQLIDFRVEKVKDEVLTLYAKRPMDVESPPIRVKLKSINAADFSPGDTITTYASNLKTRREILNEYARKIISGFSADHDKFVVDNMEYPNPIPYLQKLLEATYDTKISTIHGDLNLSNILVEMDSNNEHYQQHWLIDFSETGEGPVLLDLQWLEVQVITWLLAPEIDRAGHKVNILKDIFESLHGFRELQPHLKATLQTPYTILLEIRRLVKDYYLSRNDWNEYYRGLVIGLTGALRFDQLEDQARQIAFLSAATIIHWTEVLPSHLEGLPAAPTNIPTQSEPPFVEMNSLPKQIACGDAFLLRGGAQPATVIQIKANRITMASAQADEIGQWQSEMEFDKAGNYQITVRDSTNGAESKPIQITIVEAPTVAQNSIPAHLLVNRIFTLRGQARAKTELQILANDNVLAETNTNGAGRWQAEVSFTKFGTYEIRIQDDETGAESKPFSITVLAPPTIESASIPTDLIIRRKFVLQGNAQANTTVQLFTDQELLATTTANHAGRWRTEIALGKPGSYSLTVRDDTTGIESEPVIAMVQKSTIWANSLLLLASSIVTLLIVLVAIWFWRPDVLPAQVGHVISTAIASIAHPTSTLTPEPTATLPATNTPPPTSITPGGTSESALAYFAKKGKITVAASVESRPYSYYNNETNRFEGLEVELVRTLARQWFDLSPEDDPEHPPEGAPVLEFKPVTVTDREKKVLDDGIDFLIGAVSYSPDRCESDKSEGRICTLTPHAYDPQALLVRSDSPVNTYCDPALNSGEATLILLSNTTGIDRLSEFKANCEFENEIQSIEAPSRESALEMVESSTSRLYKTNYWLLKSLIGNNPDAFRIIPSPKEIEPIVIWLNEDNEGIKLLIDETMKGMDQERKALCKDYLDENDTGCGLTISSAGNVAGLPTTEPPLSAECNSTSPAIKIGIAINQSGNYSIFAQDQILGYTIAETYFNEQGGVNGRCIGIVDIDLESFVEETDADVLIEKFQQLVDQNVVAIIGPGLSQQVLLLNEWLQDIKTLVIGPSTTKWELVCDKDYFIRVSSPGVWYVSAAVEHISRGAVGKPRIAIAYAEDDAFAQAEGTGLAQSLIDESGIFEEPQLFAYQVNPDDWDKRVQDVAQQIIEQQEQLDIVIVAGLTKDGRLLIQELRDRGYKGPIIGGNGLNTPFIFDSCGAECDIFGSFYVPTAFSGDPENDMIQGLFDSYKQLDPNVRPKFDLVPGQFTAQMFTAIQVIVQALSEIDKQGQLKSEDLQPAGLVRLRAELRMQLLERNMQFDTPLGTISFTPDGEIKQSQFYVSESAKNSDGIGYHFNTIPLTTSEISKFPAESECTTK